MRTNRQPADISGTVPPQQQTPGQADCANHQSMQIVGNQSTEKELQKQIVSHLSTLANLLDVNNYKKSEGVPPFQRSEINEMLPQILQQVISN